MFRKKPDKQLRTTLAIASSMSGLWLLGVIALGLVPSEAGSRDEQLLQLSQPLGYAGSLCSIIQPGRLLSDVGLRLGLLFADEISERCVAMPSAMLGMATQA